jgi:Domain of unknown function (DUF5753)
MAEQPVENNTHCAVHPRTAARRVEDRLDHRDTTRRGGRRTLRSVHWPDAYETFIGFEAEAASIRTYEAQVVPGLLQTAEYARAIMQADGTFEDSQTASQRVVVRMARQTLLTRDPPPELWVILDEAVLRRPIGGQDVQRKQLLRLVEASERPLTTNSGLAICRGWPPGTRGVVHHPRVRRRSGSSPGVRRRHDRRLAS